MCDEEFSVSGWVRVQNNELRARVVYVEKINHINIQALRHCMDHFVCRLMKKFGRERQGKKNLTGDTLVCKVPPPQATGFTSGQWIITSQIS